MNPELHDLSCTLLPGSFRDGNPVPQLYNEVYQCWKRTWGEIFTRAGSPESLKTENFLRQDAVITLHHRDHVVGVLGTTIFNLSAECTYQHPYFQPFPQSTIQDLIRQGRGTVMTGEYLCVSPDFRKSVVGVSLSEVLIGLLVQLFQDLGGNVLLGTAVRPTHVQDSCKRYGYVEVGSYQKYGLDCVLLANNRDQCHDNEDERVSTLVDHYWRSRQDLTQLRSEAREINAEIHKRAA